MQNVVFLHFMCIVFQRTTEIFGELYVIGWRDKKRTHIRTSSAIGLFFYATKSLRTSLLTLQYQLLYTKVGTEMLCLSLDNTLSQGRVSFVKPFYLYFCCISEVLNGENGRKCYKKSTTPKNKVSSWEKIILQLETYFFPTGRFFPPNWHLSLCCILVGM